MATLFYSFAIAYATLFAAAWFLGRNAPANITGNRNPKGKTRR